MVGYIKAYLITFIIFFLIDLLWLGLIAKSLYRKHIGFLLKDNFNMPIAIIFYMVFIGGLIFFVINRAASINSWQYALFAGMLFGFITYSTYDITNLATLKNWPVAITIIDIIWGTVLCGTTSIISYKIINHFNILK
ncbi:MAG TPA: DUF2177 family protein [Candidatus Mcinerneyibacterium sp.]|nr:DUF2177 family protein [Candidatus Mcinerneyibacterium sp.]